MPAILIPLLTGVANLLRLPALATFIATMLAQFVGFFAQWFTAKTAVQLGVVSAVVTLTVGVFVAIKLLLTSIIIVTPPMFHQAMSLIIPDNLPLCFSAIISAHIIRWVWAWQVHFIELYASSR